MKLIFGRMITIQKPTKEDARGIQQVFYKKLGFVETGKRFVEERFRLPVSGALLPEMELVMKF